MTRSVIALLDESPETGKNAHRHKLEISHRRLELVFSLPHSSPTMMRTQTREGKRAAEIERTGEHHEA